MSTLLWSFCYTMQYILGFEFSGMPFQKKIKLFQDSLLHKFNYLWRPEFLVLKKYWKYISGFKCPGSKISSNISDLSSFFRLINLIIQLIIILKNMLIHLGASFVILVIFLILCYSHLSIDQKKWFITFSDAEKFLILKHFILTSFQFYPFVSNPALRYCTITKNHK